MDRDNKVILNRFPQGGFFSPARHRRGGDAAASLELHVCTPGADRRRRRGSAPAAAQMLNSSFRKLLKHVFLFFLTNAHAILLNPSLKITNNTCERGKKNLTSGPPAKGLTALSSTELGAMNASVLISRRSTHSLPEGAA